jgi:hypothetical protein
MSLNIVSLLQSQDKPMPIDRLDPEYQASVDRARGDLITFRLRHGLNPDPDAAIVAPPAVVLALLPKITDRPLRMTLAPESIDRTAHLADTLDRLREDGYTTAEMRDHLDKIDAANAGDR